MREMRSLLQRVAASDALVRITGESGVGKGFVARLLHRQSPRAAAPFVAIACANLPDTLFESELFGHEKGSHTDAKETRRGRLEDAGLGTVVFDGVEELSMAAQAKLLRVLESRSFERLGGAATLPLGARPVVVCGTDLEERVRGGRFRADLFYRLDVVRRHGPALRERRADIDRLATFFLRHYRRLHRRPLLVLTAASRRRLQEHPWPGNVRELRNAMEHLVLTAEGREVAPEALRLGEGAGAETSLRSAGERMLSLAQLEAAYIGQVLRRTGGNQTRAAEVLGISRKTLLEKRRRYGLA
jgi:DNA-binding NtrC family response regulator